MHLLALALLSASPALSAPSTLEHQGRLLDANGDAFTGDHSLVFSLYDTSGGQVWTETLNAVSFNNGYFSVVLGEISPLGGEHLLGQGLELGLAVDGLDEGPQRFSIHSVPFAIVSTHLQGGRVDATEVQVNGATIIDASGQYTGELDWSQLINVPNIAAGDHLTEAAAIAAVKANVSPADLGAATPSDIATHTADRGAHHQRYTDLEALSIAKTGMSAGDIGAATPADIGTHAGDASAHHTQYSNARAVAAAKAGVTPSDIGAATPADISAHAGNTSAHHTKYSNAQALAAAKAGVAPSDIGAATPSDISAHAGDAGAHHTKYTDAQALATAKAGLSLTDIAPGTVALGSTSGTTCSQAGLLRWNSQLEVCDGVDWTIVAIQGARGSVNNPGTSCLNILQVLPGSTSGLYWIDPLASGAAWETYCDMTLDGGGWTLVAYAGDNTAGFPRMDIDVAPFNAGSRAGKGSKGALAVVKTSSEMALGYHASLNFSGSLDSTADTVSFTIPDPSVVTFSTAANPQGTCVAVSARRLKPANSNIACIGSTGDQSTNASVDCNPTNGTSTAGVWSQSLGGIYTHFAYGLFQIESGCNSWPNVSHHWWVDNAFYNWEPSATQSWPGTVNGATSIWLR